MLIGNRESLGIEIRPLIPSWERRYPPERAAWAAVSLWINGENLCRHLPSGSESLEDCLNLPLAPLADWIVRSWCNIAFEERATGFATSDQLHDDLLEWGNSLPPPNWKDDEWVDDRERWWSKHFLSAAAEGSIVPSVAFLRHDEELVIEWRTPVRPALGLVFINRSGRAVVDWDEAAETLSKFVAFVAQCLMAEGLQDLYPWLPNGLPSAESAADLSTLLELYTGRKTSELQELTGAQTLADLLGRLGLPSPASDPAASPLTQALRDLQPSLPAAARDVLDRLRTMTDAMAAPGELANLRKAAQDAASATATPEEAGYAAAVAVRREVGLNGKPVGDEKELLKFVGVEVVDLQVRANATRMVTGMREGRKAAAIILESPRTAVEWGRRFEAVRALGHVLLDRRRGEAVGAGASPFARGARHRRSGAFAAELLLPSEALRNITAGVLDAGAEPTVFRDVMRKYKVGARTAAYQLWNQGLLSSNDVRDELVDLYGSPVR